MEKGLHYVDWSIIVGYCVMALIIGVYFSRRAGKSLGDFFLSGRSLPWWIAGTSMVATAFACDTPLFLSGKVREYGMVGNWFWLSWPLKDLLTVFLFAKLWRRAEIITDVELLELRYSGKPAAVLRVFSGLMTAIPFNCIVMGWVIYGMARIISVCMGLPTTVPLPIIGWTVPSKFLLITILILIAMTYSVLSGLWGVVATDLMQFVVAMIGSICLAVVALNTVGGISSMKEQLAKLPEMGGHALNFWPNFQTGQIALMTFLVWMGFQWWAPRGAGGSDYLTQRMFASKDEKHAFGGSLFYNIVSYVIRPWPWILVGLVSLVLYSSQALEKPEDAYPRMIADHLGIGLKGLLIASLLAAFMSTVDTHLNWGASYLVVDFYKRLFQKKESPKMDVLASRLAILALTGFAGLFAYYTKTVSGAWTFLAAMTAGVGPVYVLRWYWWRVNAYSEITALVVSCVSALSLIFLHDIVTFVTASIFFTELSGVSHLIATLSLRVSLISTGLPIFAGEAGYPLRLFMVLPISTVCWVAATFLTRPETKETLEEFYRRVRPPGPGWSAFRGSVEPTGESLLGNVLGFIIGVAFVYSAWVAIGKFLLLEPIEGAIASAIAIVSGVLLYRNLRRL